ncbi:hypothetical protein [Pseudomonas sp. TWI929]|uniref:hypothetical protein n=1 Tax=Pseudomonas sp. TWI929 TaxID=3136795 RepID=UPI00320ADF2C
MQVTMKGIMWGAVGTIATTALGKIVESVFEVSLISPAILTLWGWIKGLWGWLGSDVAMPVWLILLLCLAGLSAVVVIGVLVYVNYFEEGEGEELPEDAPLTHDQLNVFVAIGKAYQDGHHLGLEEILEHSQLSRIAAQRALDHLCNAGLIRPARSRFGTQHADLTPQGQDYYLELERENGWGATR